jgi:16S rRNA A1518/A1519 N6-dimethyltransferase RsmA/KsgA/DIM1 with predicted DNA glycosylase/AP lyase activity
MKSTSNAGEIYRHFKQLPGSQYMATEKAIKGLVKWLKKRRPKTMLEVGAGIGTLTFASVGALSECCEGDGASSYRLISIEDNSFCLSALKQNLKDHWGRFELIRGLG